MGNKFNENDKDMVVKFLNHVALNGKFTHSVQQSIEFVRLLKYMQTDILKKIDANVLEVKSVVDASKEDF